MFKMIQMRRIVFIAILLGVFVVPGDRLLLAIMDGAAAQTGGFGALKTSPPALGSTVLSFFNFNAGPQASVVQVSGGTFTCTGGGTPTVTNANLTANSVIIFGLKTKGGTPAQPIMTTVTPGTSFVATCGGSDTSIYNYWILG